MGWLNVSINCEGGLGEDTAGKGTMVLGWASKERGIRRVFIVP